ncbi:MAG: hypothetical protein M3276_03305 [Actinomycetota bacterium]|nr:hypothetical protein [Actinomycetota bacterium]
MNTERVLTVFLEYGDETVTVHDVLHERHGEEWSLQVWQLPQAPTRPLLGGRAAA